MKKTLLTFALILLVAPALSQNSIESVNQNELDQFKEAYNNQTSEVPDFVGSIVGGERINLKLDVNGTNQTLGAAFDGIEITNISKDGINEPTMEVWTDQGDIQDIVESQNRYQALEQKLDNEEIDYKTTTIGAGIKMTIVDTIQNVVSFIGL
ncbi:MAG: hypothetical protein V5A72_02575 [Candidatus Nanohaloarchaea archaeon]